ncbi:MAG TPA: hypothetical protein VM095_09160 [Pyrinomonadaceae bacterium]|nr:hypothetical protein [Pyrinomonadaceae bacterium]
MAINRTHVVLAVALVLITGGFAFRIEAQTKQQAARKKQVSIFLPKDGDAPDPRSNPSNLQPVMREVNAAAPLRPTIEALLAGPTQKETRQGFGGHDVRGMYIVKVAVKNGTAYASFAHRNWAGWSGDLSPLAFGDGVELTLKQFPGVRRTIVCVDGVVNFADESGGPEKKCPNF